jgi:hypothetical protein
MTMPIEGSNHKTDNFCNIFSHMSMMSPLNATVARLRNDVEMQIELSRELKNMGLTKFINLVHERDQARVAMALYAGDGIVAKITPENYRAPNGFTTYVIPPIAQKRVKLDGDDHPGNFIIETYPFVSQRGIGIAHVTEMKGLLNEAGYEFLPQDDRPHNIARLLDNSLAILDGHATKPKNGAINEVTRKEWDNKIYTMYHWLYDDKRIHPQTEKTSFIIEPPHKPASLEAKQSEAPSSFRHRIYNYLHRDSGQTKHL